MLKKEKEGQSQDAKVKKPSRKLPDWITEASETESANKRIGKVSESPEKKPKREQARVRIQADRKFKATTSSNRVETNKRIYLMSDEDLLEVAKQFRKLKQ